MKKEIILGTSYAWSTIRLFHRPSNPAYYIVDWRIYIFWDFTKSPNLFFDTTKQFKVKFGDFIKFQWPSQNIWTLKKFLDSTACKTVELEKFKCDLMPVLTLLCSKLILKNFYIPYIFVSAYIQNRVNSRF